MRLVSICHLGVREGSEGYQHVECAMGGSRGG